MKRIATLILCLSLAMPAPALAGANRCLGTGRGEIHYSAKFQKKFFTELEGLLRATHESGDKKVIKTAVRAAKKEVKDNIQDFQTFIKKLDQLFTQSENTLCRTNCSYTQIKKNQEALKGLSSKLYESTLKSGLKIKSILKYFGLTALLGGATYFTADLIQRTADYVIGGFFTPHVSGTMIATGTASIVLAYSLIKGIKSVYSTSLQRPVEPFVHRAYMYFMRQLVNGTRSEAPMRVLFHRLFFQSEQTLTRVEIRIRDRLVELYRASWSELKNIVKMFNASTKQMNLSKKRPGQIEVYSHAYRALVAHSANWLVRISNLYPELMVRLASSPQNPAGLNPVLISIFSSIFSRLSFTPKTEKPKTEAEVALEQALRNQFVVHVMNAAVRGEPNRVFKQSEAPAYIQNGEYVYPGTSQKLKLTGNLQAIESMLMIGLRVPDYSQLNLTYKNGKPADALSKMLSDPSPLN